MATVVTKKLRLDKNNIEKYCDAQNVSFNVSDHAWRKWLNGSSDGYIILKDAGKLELFPTSTARPFKADSTISASRSAGTCIVDLQFAGTKVHEEYFTSTSQHRKTKENIITGEVVEEKRYYINSIYDIDLFAKTVRKEWSIENNLHWHLDYTLKEDFSTVIDKKVAFNLNIIGKSVLSMLKITLYSVFFIVL